MGGRYRNQPVVVTAAIADAARTLQSRAAAVSAAERRAPQGRSTRPAADRTQRQEVSREVSKPLAPCWWLDGGLDPHRQDRSERSDAQRGLACERARGAPPHLVVARARRDGGVGKAVAMCSTGWSEADGKALSESLGRLRGPVARAPLRKTGSSDGVGRRVRRRQDGCAAIGAVDAGGKVP